MEKMEVKSEKEVKKVEKRDLSTFFTPFLYGVT